MPHSPRRPQRAAFLFKKCSNYVIRFHQSKTKKLRSAEPWDSELWVRGLVLNPYAQFPKIGKVLIVEELTHTEHKDLAIFIEAIIIGQFGFELFPANISDFSP